MKYDSSRYNYEMIKCCCDSFDYDDRALRLPNVPHIFPQSNDKDGITRIAAETARIPQLAVAIFFILTEHCLRMLLWRVDNMLCCIT